MTHYYDIDDHLSELANEFLLNLDDDLDFLEKEILDLFESPSIDGVRKIFAKVHSIKGSAGALGLEFISSICHNFEDQINLFNHHIDEAKGNLFFKFVDLMREYKLAVLADDIDEDAFNIKLRSIAVKDRKQRILIVQRTKSYIQRFTQILKERNVEIATARSGYDALGRILKEHFDIIVCDSQTGPINGIELVQILRIIDSSKKNKIVLISGSHENLTPAEVGFPDYLITKDIDFFSHIRKVFSELTGPKIVPDSAFTKKSKSEKFSDPQQNYPKIHKILCIEDDQIIQALIRKSLQCLELDTLNFCSNGKDGIKQALADTPDLVLLDYFLPDIDGLEVYSQIQSTQPHHHSIPIIFLTGKDSEVERQKLLEVGAIAVINKPFDPKTLDLEVEEYWRKYWDSV